MMERCLRRLKDNEPHMIDFLRRLIETPSLSGHEEKLAELIVESMEILGYDVTVDEMGSVIGTLGEGERPVIFDGHMDHVSEGSPKSWSHPPYAAEIDGDVVYGRGAVDMKASLAAMIYGCAASEPSEKVVVACVVHEETNEGVALREIIERRMPRPKACILGEPTDLKLSIGQRGRTVFKITTHGLTSHASMPELGINSIYRMIPVIERLMQANEKLPRDPFLGAGTIAVTGIRSSPEGPVVPDLCEVLVDRRLIPSESLEGVLEEMRRLAPEADVELMVEEITCYTGLRRTVLQYFPGWLIHPESRLVTLCLEALEASLGYRPETTVWRFSTDGVATAGMLGIPTVGFGPGDPSLAHRPDERVSIADVKAAARGFCALSSRLQEISLS
ncbi:MAG: YgeY family selenium metabolism-linked hydrolase [Candidatus Bathyarchaeia archaeon]